MEQTTALVRSGVSGVTSVDPIPSGSSQINVSQNERYVSVGGGALLATVGLKTGGLSGLLLTALGGFLVYRGATGYCPVNSLVGRDTSDDKTETDVVEISRSVTISKPRTEVYQFWRRLENLPQFMQHLESVTQLDDRRSHWVAKVNTSNALTRALPAVAWDAEIVEEEENSRLVGRSVPGATVDNSGEVRFSDVPGGTEVHAIIRYRAPEGIVGEAAAKLLNPAFQRMVQQDIERFKRVLEEAQVPAAPHKHPSHEGIVL